ncbi:TonB-dependent receptor [Flavobacterium sp. '19STA2R22 D10 B1']|uniref:TonB-dependent receptor n=1 Tax=Flavobacterium aerium TaxID=3037261 RepID=UPI00278C7609|nr:TonB-dependent receptor [Flavobacterium sp. '19STA2R22 D10 B1']
MKFKLLFITLFIFTIGFAQDKGTISGIVTDKEMNNESLPFANIQVKGSKISTNTDIDGKYAIQVTPGNHILVFSFLGYENVEVSFSVKAGEKKTINQALGADSVKLEDVVIKATVNREKESALLLEQQKAVTITQSIGAQELSRKGVGDAAAAVTKVTGISKQEGNSGIFVRGLGDRYNSTTLNGLPLPSNEPENKNVALDIFSTDVIQSIGVNKTYSTQQFGDVGGANINIISKEQSGKGKLRIEIGSGLNNNAFGTDFKVADGVKTTGFYNTKAPKTVDDYRFKTRWSPNSEGKPVNNNFGISGGTSFDVGENGKISAFATASYENGYKYKNGFQRIVGTTNNNIPVDYYNVDKYEFSTKTTLLANVAYKINSNNTIKVNSIFVNTSKSTVGEYDRFLGNGDDRYEYTRQTLTEQNKLFVNQLLGDHNISERLNFNWGTSFGIVKADLPDRITNNLLLNNGSYFFDTQSPSSNNRYFQFIDENEFSAKALFTYKILKNANDEYTGKLSFGYNGRIKSRDFKATQFNFRFGSSSIPTTPGTIDDFLNPDNLASAPNIANTYYMTTGRVRSLTPFTYNGDLSIHAGNVNFEQNISEKLTYTIGVRAEKVLQELKWDTNISLPNVTFSNAKIDKTFILPTASLKYSLNDTQNLRAALSKTYTLPEFKEKAPFRYEGIGENSVGNPFLKPSDNYNLDLKWEMFPSQDELISITGFGKYIKNPISKVLLNSALNDNTFVNAGDYAYVVGAEFEVRKDLWKLDETNNKQALSGGVNLTYMYSEQKLDSQKVADDTNNTLSVNFNDTKDGLQGASPLLVNADLTYRIESGTFRPTISIVGNYFHDRIYSLGSFNRGNIVEKGIATLNFISSAKIGERLSMSFNVKNLLNSKIRRVQENQEGDIDTYNFKAGLDFSVGIKYDIF